MNGWERHHVFGVQVAPYTIALPADLHRVLSERQRGWPECARHPETPLDWLALSAYTLGDLLALLADLLHRLGAYLVGIAAQMSAAYGADWPGQFAPVTRIEV